MLREEVNVELFKHFILRAMNKSTLLLTFFHCLLHILFFFLAEIMIKENLGNLNLFLLRRVFKVKGSVSFYVVRVDISQFDSFKALGTNLRSWRTLVCYLLNNSVASFFLSILLGKRLSGLLFIIHVTVSLGVPVK